MDNKPKADYTPEISTKAAWNVNAVFLLLLFGFGLAVMLHPKRSFSDKENRSLRLLPQPTADSVLSGEFESDYEDYLADQFVFRDGWISMRTLAERLMLRQDIHDIYFAKNGYLIEKHTGTFTGEQAEKNIGYLAEFAGKMAERYDPGHFTVMILPNAVKVLEDLLPPFAAPFDEAVYLDQIRERLPDGVWFDALAVLSEHSDEEIYYRTDHHWKTLGAYYVFKAWAAEKGLADIIREMYKVSTVTDNFEGTVASKVGAGVRPDSIQVYTPVNEKPFALVYNRSDDVRHTAYYRSALDTRDKYAYFLGGNNPIIEGRTNARSGRSLLVIKDSYSHCFAPFLFDLFDEVDLVDLRYYNESLAALMEEKNYTDILFIENAAGFAEDATLNRLML